MPTFTTEQRTERRYGPSELRMSEDGYLEGYAAVFNEWSVDLGGFRERIEPGAFPAELREDVRALLNHDSSLIVARTTNGTLRINEDDRGLFVRFRPADTQTGRDLVTLVKRGEIDQMSFAFWVPEDGDRWEINGGETRRILQRVGVRDVSPATFPAYPQTSLYARSMLAEIAPFEPELPHHEAAKPDDPGAHDHEFRPGPADHNHKPPGAEDDQGIDSAVDNLDSAGQVATRSREIELLTVSIRA